MGIWKDILDWKMDIEIHIEDDDDENEVIDITPTKTINCVEMAQRRPQYFIPREHAENRQICFRSDHNVSENKAKQIMRWK